MRRSADEGRSGMMMMVLCPKAGSWAFTPPGDEMSEVVSRCLPHRQLWVSNLSKVATQWREVDSNLRPFGCKPHNIPLHHGVPSSSLLLLLFIPSISIRRLWGQPGHAPPNN